MVGMENGVEDRFSFSPLFIPKFPLCVSVSLWFKISSTFSSSSSLCLCVQNSYYYFNAWLT